MPPVISVTDLTVSYPQAVEAPLIANRSLAFQLEQGEVFGILGGTGAGKSTLLNALSGMLPPAARFLSGTAILDLKAGIGTDLLTLSARGWRRLKRQRIACLGSKPGEFWNPRRTVRQHIRETLQLARRERELKAESDWMAIFYEVGLIEPENLLNRFPRQMPPLTLFRFQMAMALMKGADIWMADEPTAGLDITAEDQIFRLLRELCEKRELAILLGTSRVGVIDHLADRVAVLYEGGIVECGSVSNTFRRPKNRYTRALLDCVPRLDQRQDRLPEMDRAAERDAIDATRSVMETGID